MKLYIRNATKKESLKKDWQNVVDRYYGENKKWFEKKYKFKAVLSKQIVGVIEGKIEPGVVYIDNLMVKENQRGKGIGEKLIEKVEKYAKKYHAHKLWLLTGKNWPANSFYQRLGFSKIVDLPDFYFHKDFVLYTKNI